MKRFAHDFVIADKAVNAVSTEHPASLKHHDAASLEGARIIKTGGLKSPEALNAHDELSRVFPYDRCGVPAKSLKSWWS